MDTTEIASPLGFEATLEALNAAIGKAGLTIFARIDHAAGAAAAGLAMLPATVLIYGHAKGGTVLMQQAPLLALDLPLRVLVRQAESGAVTVAYHPIEQLLAAAGIAPPLAERLNPAQALLAHALGV